jgi:hypothetical protein
MGAESWFNGRTAVLATMHQKERVIAPLLEQAIGVRPVVPADFNTDQFGTFTRDVKRPGDQLAAARLKAVKALEITGETLAIASEGTFAPHPAFPYIACDRELVLLLDRTHDLELVGQVLSTETNYKQQTIRSYDEALRFAAKVGFPDHGLVLIANPHGDVNHVEAAQIVKGIVTEAQLQAGLAWALSQAETVQIETDMRAMMNPTRMKAIAQATEDLIQIMLQVCSQCDAPGFQIVDRNTGLQCSLCGAPTALIRSVIYQCQKCNYRQERLFPGGEVADPGQCPYCNP